MGLDVGQDQKRLCQHLGPYFYDLCVSKQKLGHLHNIWREKNILSGQVDDIPRFDGTYAFSWREGRGYLPKTNSYIYSHR